MLPEPINKVFKKKKDLGTFSSSQKSLEEWFNYIKEKVIQLGYANKREESSIVTFILISEPRHLPYLSISRNEYSDPLIQFNINGRIMTLNLFGPRSPECCIEYISLHIEFPFSIEIEYREDLNEIIRTEYSEIPVGVHAWEAILRTSNMEIHVIDEQKDISRIKTRLRNNIHQLAIRSECCRWLFSLFSSSNLYVGHDCYTQGVDVNVALSMGMRLFVLPKGKPNHYYDKNDSPGAWEQDEYIFRSHLFKWLSNQMLKRSRECEDLENQLRAESYLDQRVNNLNTLPYMEINRSSQNRYLEFKKKLNILDECDADLSKYECAWVFAFHSFSDEACIWGLDRFLSLYSLYIAAATGIKKRGMPDCIILRPHPNYYKFFDQNLISDENQIKNTGKMDMFIQYQLCKNIIDLGLDCFISGPSTTKELLSSPNTIVLTRHGNIAIEATYLGRHAVISKTAPYSDLFDKDQIYIDGISLQNAMEVTRNKMLSNQPVSVHRKELLFFQHIIRTPYKIIPPKGAGLPMIRTKNELPERLEDLTYGKDSVENVKCRIKEYFQPREQQRLIQKILGD